MKVETINKKEFQPIEIKITIENEHELHELYARINASFNSIKDDKHTLCKDLKSTHSLNKLFNVLDNLIHKI